MGGEPAVFRSGVNYCLRWPALCELVSTLFQLDWRAGASGRAGRGRNAGQSCTRKAWRWRPASAARLLLRSRRPAPARPGSAAMRARCQTGRHIGASGRGLGVKATSCHRLPLSRRRVLRRARNLADNSPLWPQAQARASQQLARSARRGWCVDAMDECSSCGWRTRSGGSRAGAVRCGALCVCAGVLGLTRMRRQAVRQQRRAQRGRQRAAWGDGRGQWKGRLLRARAGLLERIRLNVPSERGTVGGGALRAATACPVCCGRSRARRA